MPVDRHRHPDIEQKIGKVQYAVDNSTAGISSPLTTKGDIWVHATTDTRLPVGGNGQVLMADSGNSVGLSWGDVSADNVLNTVGDLLGYNGALVRIGVGTDGQALKADSSASVGISWGAISVSALNDIGDVNTTGVLTGDLLIKNATGWVDQTPSAPLEDLRSELLMQDGVTSPPVPIETEAGDDWLYADEL